METLPGLGTCPTCIRCDMPVSKNDWLTQSEMEENATYIWQQMGPQGWTMESVAAMLGNMQSESTINPGIWQDLDEGNLDGGYGLVQWTPASKYIDWANQHGYPIGDINGQIDRINWELANGAQWYPTSEYPLTFEEFKTSTQDPYYLAMAFINCYERPADPDQPWRGEQANEWYSFLGGIPPEPPTGRKGGMPIYMYLRFW